MALVYEDWYDDDFVINSIQPETIEQAETDAIALVESLGVTEEPFRRKMVVCNVYVQLAKMQLENEGMPGRLAAYQKCFDDWYGYAKAGTLSNVSNMPLGRG